MCKYTVKDSVNNITELQVITSYDYNSVYELIEKIVGYDVKLFEKLAYKFPEKYDQIEKFKLNWDMYSDDKMFYKSLFESDGRFYCYGGSYILELNDKFPDVLMQVVKIIYADIKSDSCIYPENIVGELFGNFVCFDFSDGKVNVKWLHKFDANYNQVREFNFENVDDKKIFFKNRNEYLKQYTHPIL